MSKQHLRRSIKQKLGEVSTESLSFQSKEIASTLFSLQAFQKAQSVAVYMNMPTSEVQTTDIIKHCFESGKEVYLPRCNPHSTPNRKKNHLSMLLVPDYKHVQRLQPQGKYNLLEPTEGEDAMDNGNLDLIIVPGVGFTKDGHRIGHGAGFYDEFFHTYLKKYSRLPGLVGLGLVEQLVEDIPVETHDIKMDSVIIGRCVYGKGA